MLYLIIARYRESWFDRHFRFSAPAALAAFIGALFINFWAIQQATNKASASVTDIILSNIPVFEVDGFFVYGTFAIVLISVIMLLAHPNRIPFALHSVTLFILIRSAFTLMTHLGPPEVAYVSDFGETITNSFFGADQFLSAHVVLGHIHYTIDVFSAFFITYGIYHIALWLFPRERALFIKASE